MLRTWSLPFLFFSTILHAQDPVAEMESLGSLGRIDRKELAAGQIPARANTSMNFARGLSIESCYLIALPVEQTVRYLQSSDPSPHAELEVYQHHNYKTTADMWLEELKLDSKDDATRRFIRLTSEASRGNTSLQLASRDLDWARPSNADAAQRFWVHVLSDRSQRYEQAGLMALPDYDADGARYNIHSEVASLLAEAPMVSRRFKGLIKAMSLTEKAPPIVATYYWDNTKVNRIANLSLGAFASSQVDQHWQLIDLVFYVSADYLVSVTFYELWPYLVDGKERTLIWRTDLTSSPALAGAFGLKRKIAGKIMLGDVVESVRVLQNDAAQYH